MHLAVELLVLVGVLIFIAVAQVRSRRRSEDMTSWAARNGWQYAKSDSHYAHLSMGYPYSTGHNHSTHDVVTGTWKGHSAACFTYHYDMNRAAQAGQGLHPRYFSVWLLELAAPLPAMQVRRESLISSIVLPSGMAKIDCGHTSFAQTFRVSCDDADFAHHVLTDQMTQFLLSSGGGGFDICDDKVVATRDGAISTATVTLELDYLTAVIDHLPPPETPTTRP